MAIFWRYVSGNISLDDLYDVVITSAADNNIIQYDSATSKWINRDYLRLSEISDPGFADANEAWLHAEDVAGITQVHHNTADHKWAIGQDNWIVCRNTSGGEIAAGSVVYITGSTGSRPEIAKADADLHHHGIGVAADTMANNDYGAVVTHGYVKNIDTTGGGESWIAGQQLYLSSTAGSLTDTDPTFPAAKQAIAVVVYAHAVQGILFVHHHSDTRDSDGSWDTPFTIGDGTTAGELRLLEPSGIQYTAFKAQAQAGNVTYTLPAADAAVSGYALKSDGAGALSWGAAGGEELKKSITQSTHGFSVGDVLYHNGTIYALADADTEATAEVVGIVSAVADTNTFTLLYSGYISGLSGLTAGTVYFLSATAGDLTATEPSAAGQISKPLLIADSTTSGYFFNMRGMEIEASGSNGTMPMTPQGRLTLTTATPVMVSDAASQTTIYYTPYAGSIIPIYDGTNWTNTEFSELSIAMAASANWATDKNFDLFVYNDAGTLRLVTGAAWSDGTTRAEALVRTNGIWLNNASFTGRYGASSTVSIDASRATYVGTMRTSAAGTTTWELGGAAAGGDPGKLFLWNCYWRNSIWLRVHDNTNSWTYNSTTIRSSDNSTSNRVSFVVGLNEDFVYCEKTTRGQASSTTGYIPQSHVCLDVTNADSAVIQVNTIADSTLSSLVANYARYTGIPGIGYHFLQAGESASGAETVTFHGDNNSANIKTGLTFHGMF
jgi:hypothetical protein